MAELTRLKIDALGAQADGIADDNGTPVYVPFALPGETVDVAFEANAAELKNVVVASPDRITPVCHHFGDCGGCAIQHLATEPYAVWKRHHVVQALKSRGLEAEVEPLYMAQGYRRRATFSMHRDGDDVVLGFNRAQSHAVIDLKMCAVLDPKIVAALPALRELVSPLLPRRQGARMTVTAVRHGLDIHIEGISKALDTTLRARIAQAASGLHAARITIDGDVIVESFPPILEMADVDVVLPPGGFIQAMEDAETTIANKITKAIGKAKNVADLYCGIGAFTFALARRAKVMAMDSAAEAIAALETAARHGKGLKPISARRRDLFREPLSRIELNDFDAVVFDPPRAGGEAQSRMLAKSQVKTVVAVSCNPATFARDARILCDGGYDMEPVMPIDQFHYTPHVEMVAVFRR